MKLYNLLIILIFFTQLTGCVTAPNSPDGHSTLPVAKATVAPSAAQPVSNKPAWVLNPEKSGFTSVVGFAPTQEWGGHAAQMRVAEMKARQELAQMLQSKIESELNASRDNRGAHAEDIQTRISSRVGLNLENSRVIEEWTDPQNGTLYIWLVTPNQ